MESMFPETFQYASSNLRKEMKAHYEWLQPQDREREMHKVFDAVLEAAKARSSCPWNHCQPCGRHPEGV